MNFSKYRNLIVFYAILLTVSVIILFIIGDVLGRDINAFLNLIPLSLAGTSLYILLMVSLSSIVGAVLIGFLLGPLYLFAHKKIIGTKMIYGLQDRPQQVKIKGTFLKLLFPALFTVNLCLMFYDNTLIQKILIRPEVLAGQGDQSLLTFTGLMPLMAGISMGIFSPVWFLFDGGIVFTNRNKVKDISDPIEIRSVGGWYMYLLKGYAGITVFFNYYMFLSNMFTSQSGPGSLLVYLFWPIMPFIIAALSIPCVIALDITFEKRREYIRKWARKFNITDPLEEE